MRKLWIYFLGLIEDARDAWVIAPLIISFLLFLSIGLLPPMPESVDPKHTYGFWLIESWLVLFGIQGVIFAKFRETPFFAQLWARGSAAIILGLLITVLSWGLAIMGFINSFQAR